MGKRKETKKAITDIMNADAKDGLYAREHNSPTIQELLDETTPEELEKINKEMKQTAVDFIYDEVWACYSSKLSWSDCEHLNKIKGQAKEMEKQQNDKPIDEKLFNLANEFAVLGYGDIAVKLHSIHNGFLDNKNKTYGNNK